MSAAPGSAAMHTHGTTVRLAGCLLFLCDDDRRIERQLAGEITSLDELRQRYAERSG